jgi:predicted PurR-regulated permease PerM
MNYPRVTAIASMIIAGVAVAATLLVARVVFVPIALAAVFAAVLRPLVWRMERWRVPAPIGAAVLLLGMLALVVAAGSALSEPMEAWMARAPVAAAAAGKKIAALRHRFDRISGALLPSRPAPPVPAPPAAGAGNPDSTTTLLPPVIQVTAAPVGPDLSPFLSRAFGSTTEVVSTGITMLLLLFFLLAGGQTWRDRLLKAAPSAAAGQHAVDVIHEIQQVISRYFFATLLINLGQGILVWIAMAAVGMPGPLMWGVLTAVAEFIPYAGGFVMVVLLALVGLTVSDSAGHALIAPGLYLLITMVQNNLVSPLVYGRGLKLHPVPILVAVVVGWFFWGVPGAFLAVPILATLKILCGRIEGLSGLGAFIAD